MADSPQIEVMRLMIYKFSNKNDKNLIPLILTLVEGIIITFIYLITLLID